MRGLKIKNKKETVKFCEIEQNGKTRLIPESRPRTWTGSRERRQNESDINEHTTEMGYND